MRIALSGAHRTGKSFLAHTLSRRFNWKLEPMAVSEAKVWDEFHCSGYEMLFAERVTVQRKLMKYVEETLSKFDTEAAPGLGIRIVDRSPIDLLGYLFANIDYTCSDIFLEDVQELKERAKQLTLNYINAIVLVPPGINVPVDPKKTGKVYSSEIYKEAVSSVIYHQTQELVPSSMYVKIPQGVLHIDQRVRFIRKMLFENESP